MKSQSFTIIISSYQYSSHSLIVFTSAGLNLDFGIIRAFKFSSHSMFVTLVEFSAKVTFQGYRCIVESQEDVSSIPNKCLPITTSMEQIIFDAEGTRNLLKNLNRKKANGPDNIF